MNHVILIVEDDPLLRAGMAALLRPHAVLPAATVAEARQRLAAAAAAAPTHAILDLNLPDGTGLDVLADLRDRGLPTRVMVMTGAADGELVAAARGMQVDAVVTKPPDWEAIVRWAGQPAAGDGNGDGGAPLDARRPATSTAAAAAASGTGAQTGLT